MFSKTGGILVGIVGNRGIKVRFPVGIGTSWRHADGLWGPHRFLSSDHRGLSPLAWNVRGVRTTTYLHLELRLIMRGAMPPLQHTVAYLFKSRTVELVNGCEIRLVSRQRIRITAENGVFCSVRAKQLTRKTIGATHLLSTSVWRWGRIPPPWPRES
jgi:hypothetical protein